LWIHGTIATTATTTAKIATASDVNQALWGALFPGALYNFIGCL